MQDRQGALEGTQAGWATWLLGSQRFMIVSEDPTMLQNPSSSLQMERLNQEFELSFNSIFKCILKSHFFRLAYH